MYTFILIIITVIFSALTLNIFLQNKINSLKNEFDIITDKRLKKIEEKLNISG